ncbi:hypothetical protein PIB30_107381 [Stylosanthes scabra]|uniref:UBN2 domain-containing protein n=1 Tax=Stylosanthes scabra TaxID=79078 RepID=A0ABU6WXM8_9FABA|nr:hypothetical protein [Stylosanthes scabra]
MLGKEFTEEEIVDKVLWSLTRKWDSKITAIEEGRNFNVLTYDQLRGNLLAYEVKYLNNRSEEEKKKKSLALKSSNYEEDEIEEFEDEEEELAFLLKRFNRLVGHIKPNCPKAQKEEKEKRFKKKKKAYISWENDESNSSDEDENANICLMAKDSEVCDFDPNSSNELQDEYDPYLKNSQNLPKSFHP